MLAYSSQPAREALRSDARRFNNLSNMTNLTNQPRDTVIVVDTETDRHSARTGQQLVEALQSSPHQDLDIAPPSRIGMPVREVDL